MRSLQALDFESCRLELTKTVTKFKTKYTLNQIS